jgi:hypothetical protein
LKRNVPETTQKLCMQGELHTIMWPIATRESRKTALVGLFQNPNLGAVNNVRPSSQFINAQTFLVPREQEPRKGDFKESSLTVD